MLCVKCSAGMVDCICELFELREDTFQRQASLLHAVKGSPLIARFYTTRRLALNTVLRANYVNRPLKTDAISAGTAWVTGSNKQSGLAGQKYS
jgi:hypothetical protein